MLEMDCVYNSLRQIPFEIGETENRWVAYFKHTRPIAESLGLITAYAEHFGLTLDVIGRKIDLSGNVLKVRFR
jgi:hypothetical protein